MDNMIQKLIAIVLLIGLNNLYADKLLFDLRAQDYANTLKEDVISSKYKINNKIVLETNLNKSSSGIYYINDNNTIGFCNIEIQSSLTNWTFESTIVYQSYNWNKDRSIDTRRLIKLIDKQGNIIILEFYKNGFSINGKEFKAEIDNEQCVLNIRKISHKIIFNINGQQIYTINNLKFTNLQFIHTDILNWIYDYSYFDRLQDLKLYAND